MELLSERLDIAGVIMDTDKLRNNCESDSDDSGVSCRLNELIQVRLEAECNLTCGIETRLGFRFIGSELPEKVTLTLTSARKQHEHTEVVNVLDGKGTFIWKPPSSDDWSLKFVNQESYIFAPDAITLHVDVNYPLVTFNEEEYWPVASAVDDINKVLYVAYSQHISVFDLDGYFIKGLLNLQYGFYYDLLVSQYGKALIASVSGFAPEDRGTKARFQEVHVYDVESLQMVHIIGRDRANERFQSPVLSIAKKTEDVFIIADCVNVSEVSVKTGKMLDRVYISNLGSVSRLVYTNQNYVIADASTGHVKVFDTSGVLVSTIEFCTTLCTGGLVGLAIDQEGNVVTADCISGLVMAHDSGKRLMWTLNSDVQQLKWPVHVTIEGDRHIFVCDHGNNCVKKFRIK